MTETARRISQKQAIAELLTKYPGWWTLAGIEAGLFVLGTLASEAGISARLRDLRKEGWTVERRLKQGAKNLWEYRLSP